VPEWVKSAVGFHFHVEYQNDILCGVKMISDPDRARPLVYMYHYVEYWTDSSGESFLHRRKTTLIPTWDPERAVASYVECHG
jgi:hypothetical protein